MVTTSGVSAKSERTATNADDELPAGGTTEPGLPGQLVVTGASAVSARGAGVNGEGDAGAGGEFVNGTAYLYFNGTLIDSAGYDGTPYTLSGVPEGVPTGESITDRSGDNKVVNTTESGGFDEATFSGGFGSLYSSFTNLTVHILDADGNPVGGDRLVFDASVEQTTAGDGSLTFQSAGSVDVEALDGSVTDTVDLSGGPASRTYQYAGVEGTVATPDGDPIAGKTVVLTDAEGVAIAATETDDTGAYRFPLVPVKTDTFVFNDPYFRGAQTRGQGQYVAKTFPSTVMQLGEVGDSTQIEDSDLVSVLVECVDADTGDPVTGLPVTIGDYETATGQDGVGGGAVLNAAASGEDTVDIVLGDNNRYQRQRLTVDRSDPAVGTVELERFKRTDQT